MVPCLQTSELITQRHFSNYTALSTLRRLGYLPGKVNKPPVSNYLTPGHVSVLIFKLLLIRVETALENIDCASFGPVTN
jgi:hypothetical protein